MYIVIHATLLPRIEGILPSGTQCILNFAPPDAQTRDLFHSLLKANKLDRDWELVPIASNEKSTSSNLGGILTGVLTHCLKDVRNTFFAGIHFNIPKSNTSGATCPEKNEVFQGGMETSGISGHGLSPSPYALAAEGIVKHTQRGDHDAGRGWWLCNDRCAFAH